MYNPYYYQGLFLVIILVLGFLIYSGMFLLDIYNTK